MSKKPAAKPAAPAGGVKEFKADKIWVKVDYSKCAGAGACVDTCPENVYSVKGGKVVVQIDLCSECGACNGCCPHDALVGHSSW